jgi:carbonic anhydrase/acetyltransferase-like protein (isoleucine patch superfamily)
MTPREPHVVLQEKDRKMKATILPNHPVSFALCAAVALAGHSLSAHHIDAKAEIHPTAVLIGNVTVGPYSRIGPKVVIQGDVTIGHHVNILGQAVINADKLTVGNYVRIDYGSRVLAGRPAVPGITANTAADPTYIKDNCWVGMNATVRGVRMEEGAVVGMRAVAEFGSQLERGALLAPGAVAPHDTTIPADSLAEGLPARVTREAITDKDRQTILGVVPSTWIHAENDQIARQIDLNPPKPRSSYAGIDGRPFWKDAKVDPTAQVHPTAILLNATIGAQTRVGPNVVIMRAVIGHHCDIRANTNIRADTVIGNYCLIGERVHVGSARDGGFDNPLWIKDYAYIGPGSVVHATKIDEGVYYGPNALTDYGCWVHRNVVLMSGASALHDTNIREDAVFRGSPGMVDKDPGISDQLRLQLLGFLPRRWLAEVNAPSLEKAATYEPPLPDWEHTNKGTVHPKAQIDPGAIVLGHVSLDEEARLYPGSYVEGDVRVGRQVKVLVGVMIASANLDIGDHTHIYDQAMIVDGRTTIAGTPVADMPCIGAFSWINHMVSLQGATMEDFSLSNIGTGAPFGTRIGREALLLNGAVTYADQQLPARSITYGIPGRVRLTETTMRERMLFFYGRDWPNWERQAKPEDLKRYQLPE